MDTTELSQEIMSSIEKDKLIAFNEDRVMFEAVRKHLLTYLYQGVAEKGKPFEGGKNYALQLAWDRQGGAIGSNGAVVAYVPKTNEDLGADLRALARGVNIIEGGFKELSEMKRPVDSPKDGDNPAL